MFGGAEAVSTAVLRRAGKHSGEVPSNSVHVDVRLPCEKTSDRVLLGGTVGVLLVAPVLASKPALWEAFVATALLSAGGLFLLWHRDVLSTSEILWGALLLRLVYFPLLPELTDDPFRYIWDGWLQMEGINPYRYAPEADGLERFQEAEIYDRLNSKPYYSIYPPLTQFVFAVGGLAYSIDWTVGYYVIKFVLVAAEFGGLVGLAQFVSAPNLLLYAWNPLILVETAGQGHPEALLVPCLVGAIWAVRRDRGRIASVAVAAAGMIKLYPFVLWPYLLRRYGLSAVWPGALIAVGVSLPYTASYVLPHIKESMDLFAELFEFNAGPYYLVKYVLWTATGADWSKVIGPTFRYLFLGSLPLLYILDWKMKWTFRQACLITIGLLFALSTTVHPWYLVPIVALSVIERTPTWSWLWLSILSIGTYLFYVDGTYWLWIILGWGGGVGIAIWLYFRPLWARMRGLLQDP